LLFSSRDSKEVVERGLLKPNRALRTIQFPAEELDRFAARPDKCQSASNGSSGPIVTVIKPSFDVCEVCVRPIPTSTIQRGTALLTTSKTPERIRENYNVSRIPDDDVEEINRIQTRSRLNSVVQTGVPGFIAKGG